MFLLRAVVALAIVGTTSSGTTNASTPAPRVTVLAVALNNLSNLPDDPPERVAALGDALRSRLAGACGYVVLPADSLDEARGHAGRYYYYDHPDDAAKLARDAGAEWVLIPRLNRASPWVTDLQLHVVRASDGAIVSNRAVELKGFGMRDDHTEKLTVRGAAWMADQIDRAIALSDAPDATPARRCRP
jgi:hypothetical protein